MSLVSVSSWKWKNHISRQQDSKTARQEQDSKQQDSKIARQQDSKTARQQDSKTARQQDSKTARQHSETASQQDSKTARQQDSKTARQHSETARQWDSKTARQQASKTVKTWSVCNFRSQLPWFVTSLISLSVISKRISNGFGTLSGFLNRVGTVSECFRTKSKHFQKHLWNLSERVSFSSWIGFAMKLLKIFWSFSLF
jgi:flagellar biosynthesis GTPase FlhF